ncbi:MULTISPECIES: bacillithiol biosynthesis deacetylase BshB2 [unclassified Sporosarcina]|uniref:bacillithiol biosynthesis deacetylase BshB2 n=1 Tax=unclassified Sporosarcina TaxID=2647733 RepID=UPI000C1686F9|nr:MULTISPECIES: bacillithiol biosynthesis deacetylase BshB2 [unclassified Sporosarcina]PID05328.1 bacillithiol biosynthesis deacetylase BshB2 [Sporosarcina sp. P30]PID08446.1 bacillithiol biosynthesis deacetylase BshB2 [Sporosarcina sp. P31]PID12226.1 bacillithiol biosynthesis deacetylase BshB2 [Sporosarcina sp. P32b]
MMLQKERHVLVVFPHPDDESFGIAGTIAEYIEMGVPVTYACLTLGEMGRNLGNPPFANRETLPQIRKQELLDACDAMGLTDLRMMGLRDKTIEFEDPEKLVKMMTDLIEELTPSLVISFHPTLAVHPDHNATGVAVIEAMSRMPEANRPVLYMKAFDNDTLNQLGEPHVVHQTPNVADKKIAALRAHASQTVWMLPDMEKRWAANDKDALDWLYNEAFYIHKFN